MNPQKTEPYRPTTQAVNLLYTVANLAHSISNYAIVATFAISPNDLKDYMILMNEHAAEIQRLIQQFEATPKETHDHRH